jgi:hypothetical protein
MGVTTQSKSHALISVIEDYQKNMGYVDRHNRFRQNLLGLHKIWRTKKWQVRVILDLFGIALVDSFLLARKFIPRWTEAEDTALLPQVASEYEGTPAVSL